MSTARPSSNSPPDGEPRTGVAPPPARVQGESAGVSSVRSGGTGWALLAGIWLAIGCFLRFARLEGQVFGGDESHLILEILQGRLPKLLFEYGLADHSLPMAAFGRIALEFGGTLTDATLRVLPLAFGVGLLATILVGRRWLATEATVLTWLALAAASPFLIVYSRMARSYGIAATLMLVTAMALARWQEDRRRSWGLLASVAGALGAWFHPVVLLVPAAGFGAALWSVGRRPGPTSAAARRELLGFAGLFALLCALFLVPGAPSLLHSLDTKVGRGGFAPSALVASFRLLAGHAHPIVAAAVAASALTGLIRGFRQRPSATLLFASCVATHSILIAATMPLGTEEPRVVARYLLPVWPLVLLWAADGLVAGLGWVARGLRTPRNAASFASLTVALVAVTGPLMRPEVRFSSFLHMNDSLGFLRPVRTATALPLPDPYRWIAATPGTLLEFPVHAMWSESVAVPSYQRVHRRKVLVARPFERWNDPRLRLSGHVRAQPEAFLASTARFLFLHRDPITEERRVLGYLRPRATREYAEADNLKNAAAKMERRLREAWGAPSFEGDGILIWDLDVQRRRLVDPDRER